MRQQQDKIRKLSYIVIPTLSDDDMKICDNPITIDEMGKAILKMNNGSTPGIDGIPIEFYKVFYNEIKFILFNCFLYNFETKTLSISQQKGIVSLLHKGKELDRTNLDNWRPLSLTNADYKILAKILARRTQVVIRNIVHNDQC